MEYKTYQHIERLGTDATEGILDGQVYVFTKLDGSNGTIFMGDDGEIKVGSRNKQVSVEDDNAGFCSYILSQDKFKKYLEKHPMHRLYGEWLIRQNIKYYEEDAWRKFYVFDVVNEVSGKYLSYEEYTPLLEEFGIEYIPLIARFNNPSIEDIQTVQDKCTYLTKDNQIGEGVVVKNYDFVNKYGRTNWGKIVLKKQQVPSKEKAKDEIEQEIVDKYCTDEFIAKERAKFISDKNWQKEILGNIIASVWHTFIEEECWNIVKEYHNPIINFKMMQKSVATKVRSAVLGG